MKAISIALLIFFFTCAVSVSIKAQTITKTPSYAAQGLYKSWSAGSRKTAQNYARQEPVDKLFGVKRQRMTFKGCKKREEGDFECLYENKKLDLTMAMIVKIFRVGYRVTEVSFSSEAI